MLVNLSPDYLKLTKCKVKVYIAYFLLSLIQVDMSLLDNASECREIAVPTWM